MSCKKNSIIRKKILAYYENNKRDLPWRTEQDNNQNPYYTLVSEIMLQQTQVNTALVYYKKFIKKWPNLNSLAQANIEDVLTMWSGLGYYSRAKNLLKAAKIISEKHNGTIPDKYEDLILDYASVEFEEQLSSGDTQLIISELRERGFKATSNYDIYKGKHVMTIS